LSWLERALDLDVKEQPDGRLLYSWIAFNSLYGTWDHEAGFPAKDRVAWQDFVGRLLKTDHEELLAKQLATLRSPLFALLDNKFLDSRFWQDPETPRNHHSHFHRAPSLFVERRWCDLLVMVLDRIYVLRGQIFHGAATRGSSLNRTSLRHSNQVLEGLLPTMLHLAIEHGTHDNWPPLCYPPIDQQKQSAGPGPLPRRAR
jgi:hypothetical protein